jgi:hypothetical protein
VNSLERIEAAIALEMPDRVPLSPLLDHWAATYAGITNAECMADPEKRIRAILKTAIDFQWDMTYIGDTINPQLLKIGIPLKLKQPGVDLPENSIHQFDERGYMNTEDYDLLAAEGLVPFLAAITTRIYPDMSMESMLTDLEAATMIILEHSRRVQEAGIVPAVGFTILGPSFEYFNYARGITQGFIDLRRQPEKIKSAGKRFAGDLLSVAIESVNRNHIRRVFIGLSRSSPAFISPKQFEEFVLPELEFYAQGFTDAGINVVFHCDTDWSKCLHYFRRFPQGKCLLMLDSFTDIFKAKEVLGDWMAIQGDVPAMLTSDGTKDEVLNYCRRLIENVGAGGGFILGSGCSLPVNAKPENVQALTEAVQERGWYA